MEQSTYTYSSTYRCTSCTVKYYYCRKVQIIIPVSVQYIDLARAKSEALINSNL